MIRNNSHNKPRRQHWVPRCYLGSGAGDPANQFSLRKRNDGQVIAEFEHQRMMEKIVLSTLQLYELEILAQYALHRAFEPARIVIPSHLASETVAAAAQIA